MKYMLSTLICIAIYWNASSQIHKINISFNPFSLLESDAGPTPGIGYSFNDRWAILSDVGGIFYKGLGSNTSGRPKGFKLKPAVRYYLKASSAKRIGYLELEGTYKNVDYRFSKDIAVIDQNGNFAAVSKEGYVKQKQVYGIAFKIGYRTFESSDNRFGVDAFVGLGLRTYKLQLNDLPEGGITPKDADRIPQKSGLFGEGPAVSIPLGVKLFYCFFK